MRSENSKLTNDQKKKVKKTLIAATAAVGIAAGLYIAYRTGAVDKFKDSLGALDSTVIARIAAKVGLFDLPNE